jgi:DNA-binding YbaB/EbfC family protein
MSDEDSADRPDRGNGPERPLFPDFSALLSQFEQAGERLESAAAAARRTVVEGTAGEGAVRIRVSGDLEAVSVSIDPAMVEQGDVSLLEDLVLAALRDTLAQLADLQEDVAEAAEAPSIDLSSLGGLLGGLAGGAGSGGSGVLGNISEVLGGLGLGLGAGGDTEKGSEVGEDGGEGGEDGGEDGDSSGSS